MDLHVNKSKPVTYGNDHHKNPFYRGDDIKQSIMREQQGQGVAANIPQKESELLKMKTIINNLENTDVIKNRNTKQNYEPGSLFLAKA